MAEFMLIKRGTLKEVHAWASDAIRTMRAEGLNFPLVRLPDEHRDVAALCFECSETKEQELMSKYNWIIGQTVMGIDFMQTPKAAE